MTVTQQHLEFIAATLRAAKPQGEMALSQAGAYLSQWRMMVDIFADKCAASNPKFKRDKFLKACGVD